MSASFTDEERDYLFRGLHERIERDEARAKALKESLLSLVDHWEKEAMQMSQIASVTFAAYAETYSTCAKEIRELLDK